MKQTLLTLAARHDIPLTDEQGDLFAAFGHELVEKTKVMNLTGITEPEAVALQHFLDCIFLTRAVDLTGKTVVDVGCGAGFPGVPLKIAVPSMKLTLLDSLGKRILWLREEALPACGIDAECVVARAEEFAALRREQYDIAVSRAVARLNVLAELSLPLVKTGGCFVAMKGAMARQELEEAGHAIAALGGKLERVFDYPIGEAVHSAVVIKKVGHTPPAYPRRFAKIKQQPL